jgi:hypothetical protein
MRHLNEVPNVATVPTTWRGTSTGALQFGGGLEDRTLIKVFVPVARRAEVRDFYPGKPAYNMGTSGTLQHHLGFLGGLVQSF